jgi:hypothetical protein
MKRLTLVSLACLMFGGMFVINCKKEKVKEKDKTAEVVLSQNIQNMVPDSILTKIVRLGMVINKGNTPPGMVNSYKVSPYTLKCTTITGDYNIGSIFADYNFRLYDQDNINLTVKLGYVNGNEIGTGLGGYTAGSGDGFSIFVKVRATCFTSQADILQIISGTVSSDGIHNFCFANYMLNNYGNPLGLWMDNGQGRVFFDADAESPVVNSLQAKAKGKVKISGSLK